MSAYLQLPWPRQNFAWEFAILALVFVLFPTVLMYREARGYSDRPGKWTGAMLVGSVVVPVLGPVVLWTVYSVVEFRGAA